MSLQPSPNDAELGLFDFLSVYFYRALPTNDSLETWFDFECFCDELLSCCLANLHTIYENYLKTTKPI